MKSATIRVTLDLRIEESDNSRPKLCYLTVVRGKDELLLGEVLCVPLEELVAALRGYRVRWWEFWQ